MISNFPDEPVAGPAILPAGPPASATPREPSVIVFDIETGPRPVAELESMMPEFEAPSNYKDPEKIAKAIEEKRAAWIEKAALSPLTGQVLAIGCLVDGRCLLRIGASQDNPESHVIEWFLSLLGTRTTVIGFNSNRFDWPFLMKRCWHLGIPWPTGFGGRGFGRSIDLMEVWQAGDRTDFVSLDTVAKFFGVGAKTGSGGQFADLLKFDPAAAARYLENDVRLTAAVAERMGFETGCGESAPDAYAGTNYEQPPTSTVGDDDY